MQGLESFIHLSGLSTVPYPLHDWVECASTLQAVHDNSWSYSSNSEGNLYKGLQECTKVVVISVVSMTQYKAKLS